MDLNLIFLFTVTLVGALVTFATLAIYFFSKSYKTLRDRCEIIFLVGYFITYLAEPSLEVSYNLFLFFLMLGFFMSELWLNILCFDVWWILRNMTVTCDEGKKFKFFCVYGLGVVPILFLATFTFTNYDHFFDFDNFTAILTFLIIFMIVAGCANLFILGSTGIKVFQLSKTTNNQNHAWFEVQKERQGSSFIFWWLQLTIFSNFRFWCYVQVCFIITLTWPIELFESDFHSYSTVSVLTYELLTLFSTILIYVVLAGRKLLDLLKTYESFENPLS